jgi:hypothetical protein
MSANAYIIAVDDNVRKIIEQGIHDLENAKNVLEDEGNKPRTHTLVARGLTALVILKSKIEEKG